ncbi:PKD domain-containing protein, partial [Cellulomonas persica]|uniref:PKD domain-containing protein n=1 Tax=Cellulomonas persica TaxID=76861 RepID=UPI001C99D5B9
MAAFTSSTNGLTVSVDGSGSTDSDGTIAGYAWNFGDSATGTGATASHAYAAGGTYTVTLTVTDDDGAEHSVSHDVTVVAPEPGVAAADAFGRTTATGWGSADTGGAWTLSGAASLYSVSGGAGRLTANPGATPRTRLDEVSVRDVDVTQVVSLDRLSDTGTALVWVSARTSGWTSEYQAQARISQTGGVTLRIVRRLASGDTSLANVVVPGLTYAAGDRLHLRLQAVGEGTTTLRSRLWADGQA